MKTLRMKFKTDAGKDYTVRLNYADPALGEEGGKARVDAAAAEIIAKQPFTATIASYGGADLVERTVTEILA